MSSTASRKSRRRRQRTRAATLYGALLVIAIATAALRCGIAPPNYGVSTEFLNPHSHGGPDAGELGFDAGVFVYDAAVPPASPRPRDAG